MLKVTNKSPQVVPLVVIQDDGTHGQFNLLPGESAVELFLPPSLSNAVRLLNGLLVVEDIG